MLLPLVVAIASAASLGLTAQSVPEGSPAGTSVKFTLDFPASNPEHYSIDIWANGRAVYDSLARLTDDAGSAEMFHWDFEIPAASRERVFALAQAASFFSGKLESGRKLAFTGKKTLEYEDGKSASTGTYNYSDLHSIQELTVYFQSVSQTLELVRRLDYDQRYQKLALDADLKNVEAQMADKQLAELQAAAPVLEKIAADAAVVKVARARAQRLLEISKP